MTRSAQPSGHFNATHPWHAVVEDDDLRRVVATRLQRPIAVDGFRHQPSTLLEQHPEREAHVGFVVNDEDLARCRVGSLLDDGAIAVEQFAKSPALLDHARRRSAKDLFALFRERVSAAVRTLLGRQPGGPNERLTLHRSQNPIEPTRISVVDTNLPKPVHQLVAIPVVLLEQQQYRWPQDGPKPALVADRGDATFSHRRSAISSSSPRPERYAGSPGRLGRLTGSETVNVVPWPTRLSHRMVPP